MKWLIGKSWNLDLHTLNSDFREEFCFQHTCLNFSQFRFLNMFLKLGNDNKWALILKPCFPFQFKSLSCVWLFVTPWTAARQASRSVTNSQSLLKLMPIESVMPSNHLILWHPLLLLPSIFPYIRVFSNESAFRIRGPKYWSFSFSIVLPMNKQDWFPLGRTGLISVQSKGLSVVFSDTLQKHQFFGAQFFLWSNS